MYRYKITVEYIGTEFSGWQRQLGAISIQQVLEEAISKFTGEKVIVTGSGRTDAGVHAIKQVAHFDINKHIEPFKVARAINYFVKPYPIGISDCSFADNGFHARFSAIARHYMYRIINRDYPLIIDRDRAWWVRDALDVQSMQKASTYLLGKHDFTSFRAISCQAKSATKTLTKIDIINDNADIRIYLSAPSFLHHMVRNIVGSLVLVGKSIWQSEKIKTVLLAKDRRLAGPTAPACGLYFMSVEY